MCTGQLRTGMARLNGYLHRIGAADTAEKRLNTSSKQRLEGEVVYPTSWEEKHHPIRIIGGRT